MKATLNLASVMKKLDAWERSPEGEEAMQTKIAEYIRGGVEKTKAGSQVTTLQKVEELAEDLKEIVVSLAGTAPDSVVVNVQSLSAGEASLDNDKIQLVMEFTDDLSRPSLDPEKYPEGAKNIIVLFDKGYSAGGAVFGEWHEDLVWSLRTRKGLGFMERAVDNFNSLYGSKWGIRAELQGDFA